MRSSCKMSELSVCRPEKGNSLEKLIDELEQLTEKYVVETEKLYRSIYDQASQARQADTTGFSVAKKYDLPKLADKGVSERLVYQYLDRLKQLSVQLNALSVNEQTLLFLDHLELYKQKTIDFCRSTLDCPSASKPDDHSREFAQIVELFRELKTKLDVQLDRQLTSGSSSLHHVNSSGQVCASIQQMFDRHFKHTELDAIDFDELIDETTRCIQLETCPKGEQGEKKADAKKEIDFQLSLITERARIGLKRFEDELARNQTEELSDFAEGTIKAMDALEGSLRFDLQFADYEDEQFNAILTAISSSMETFVSKVYQAIADALEKSFREQYELNEELIANLSKLAGTVLAKRLGKHEALKDPKLDVKYRKGEPTKGHVLRKRLENLKRSRKARYTKGNDLTFKTTDLVAVITKHAKHAQNAEAEEDASDCLFKAVKSQKKINFPSMYQISVPSSSGRTDKNDEKRQEQLKEELSKLIVSSKKSIDSQERKVPGEPLEKKKTPKMLKPEKKARKDSLKRSEKKGK